MPASQVDHIVPLSKGGAKSDPANLQAFCHSHHSIKTIRHDGGFGRRGTQATVKSAKDAKTASCATPERVGILDPHEGTLGRKD